MLPFLFPSLPLIHRTKKFTRWLNGTCIEVEPIHVPDKDEPVVFNYFEDLSNHSGILDHATALQEVIKEGINALLRQAHWWKKYRALWKMQKVPSLLCKYHQFITSYYNNNFINCYNSSINVVYAQLYSSFIIT